jgi:ketosteroid isomerase-like protein
LRKVDDKLPDSGVRSKVSSSQSQEEKADPVKNGVQDTVTRRFDAIKIRSLMDDRYDKFDDWPPFERQDYGKALENEFGAFKVLANYTYDLKDFRANVFGDMAVATFTIHYSGQIRKNSFEVTSRVTTVLKRSNSDWKIIHEHFSRFPEQTRQQYMPPRRMMQP